MECAARKRASKLRSNGAVMSLKRAGDLCSHASIEHQAAFRQSLEQEALGNSAPARDRGGRQTLFQFKDRGSEYNLRALRRIADGSGWDLEERAESDGREPDVKHLEISGVDEVFPAFGMRPHQHYAGCQMH